MKIKWTPGAMRDMEKLFSSSLRWKLYRLYKFMTSDLWYEIKWAYQRVFRGWDDRASWGLHSHLEDIIIPIIHEWVKFKHGAPMGITEGQWTDVLRDIQDGFVAAKEIGGLDYIEEKMDEKEKQEAYDSCMRRFNKGMILFHRYYFNLWD